VLLETVLADGTARRADRIGIAAAMERRRSGLAFGALDAGLAGRVFGDPVPRVLVTESACGAPAWLAGVRRGDRVLSVDGEPPGSPGDLVARLAAGQAGRRVALEVEALDGRHRFEFPLADDVDARSGTNLSFLYGSEGNRRRWDTWVLGGLPWYSVRAHWETATREPEGLRWVGVLVGFVWHVHAPDRHWLGLAWGIVPIPLP
jgi:hypothetical protein